jgi:hypothetical protein
MMFEVTNTDRRRTQRSKEVSMMLERGSIYSSPPKMASPYRRRNQHMRYGVRAAALRAVTAARLYLAGTIPNLLKAAESCGSNVCYVRAAIAVLRSENAVLLDRVLRGHVSILAAANRVRRVVALLAAYQAADEQDHVASFRVLGPDRVFEEIVQAVG